jgi:hypothetical protein
VRLDEHGEAVGCGGASVEEETAAQAGLSLYWI